MDYAGLKEIAKRLGTKHVAVKKEKMLDNILDKIEELMELENWADENQDLMEFYEANTEGDGEEEVEKEEVEEEEEVEELTFNLEEEEKKVKEVKKEADKKKIEKKEKKKQNKNPGVIATIVTILSETKKGVTIDEIVARLTKAFPERNPEGMKKTVKVQIGGRIKKEKGLNVSKDDDKYTIK